MKALLDPIDGIIEGLRDTVIGIPLWFALALLGMHVGWALAALDDSWVSYSPTAIVSWLVFSWLGALGDSRILVCFILLVTGLVLYYRSARFRTESVLLTLVVSLWYGYATSQPEQGWLSLYFPVEHTVRHIGIPIGIALSLAAIAIAVIRNRSPTSTH